LRPIRSATSRRSSSINTGSTSQPSPAAFKQLCSFLAAYYESIIAIHVSGRLSGAFSFSTKEAALVPGTRISVIDLPNDSGSEVLIVLRAAELIAIGKKPLFIQEISPIIALNAGKNTLAVALMKE
jgi:fatty acid-binding protein DegV